MSKLLTLASSSKGNCTYIGNGEKGILIDAGISCKRIKNALMGFQIDPASLQAVFITHEHADHVAGLRVFASAFHIPVYATGGTLSGLNNAGILSGGFPFQKIMSTGVQVGDFKVTPFATVHDAKESCGYRIDLPGKSVGIATDTGIMTEDIFRFLSGCELILLESNYDETMLDLGPYSYSLKARIRSRNGHLSNTECAETAVRLLQNGTRRFVLGHLSQENNTPEKAFACTESALRLTGADGKRDYRLSVAPVGCMEQIIFF